MAAEAEVEAQVASLQLLLGSKLPAEDAVEFGASDLRLLVRKGYHTERRLRQATANELQGPPGDAVQPFLIKVLLTAFNPAALQQGSTASAKHTASLSIAAFLLQFAPSALLPIAANTRPIARPEVHVAAQRPPAVPGVAITNAAKVGSE